MIYRTRKLVKPGDLNSENTLFGGRLLEWIDEECAIFAACQLKTKKLRTKIIGEINFLAPAHQGDIVEIGVNVSEFGTTSITLKASVRNKDSEQEIVAIDKIVMVSVDENGNKTPHGQTAALKVWERFTREPYPYKNRRPSSGELIDHYVGFYDALMEPADWLESKGMSSEVFHGEFGMPACEDFTKLEKATNIPAEDWMLAEFEYRKERAEEAKNKAAGTAMAGYCKLCRAKELELYGTIVNQPDERHEKACKEAGCLHPVTYY